MKTKIFLTLAVGILFTNIHLQAMTRNSSYGENPRVLIAYFSATGTTARIARQLADITGGTLYAIRPERPLRTTISTGAIPVRAAPSR